MALPSSVTRAASSPRAGARPDSAPTPILPLGAGGPLWRAAGWVPPHADLRPAGVPRLALVSDPDPLRRLHALAAVRALGFIVDAASWSAQPPAAGNGAGLTSADGVVFLALDRADACPRVGLHPARGGRPCDCGDGVSPHTILVGYGTCAGSLAAHRRHRCVDAVLRLTAAEGEACFAYLPAVTTADSSGVTSREADVLVLMLAGLPGSAIADRLHLSPATVRAHRRALMRRFGVANGRALRARLLEDP